MQPWGTVLVFARSFPFFLIESCISYIAVNSHWIGSTTQARGLPIRNPPERYARRVFLCKFMTDQRLLALPRNLFDLLPQHQPISHCLHNRAFIEVWISLNGKGFCGPFRGMPTSSAIADILTRVIIRSVNVISGNHSQEPHHTSNESDA